MTGPILITGGNGQVGTELRRQAGDAVFAPDIDTLDLAEPAAVTAMVASRPWSAVLSVGAYTAVDKAETDVAAAWAANALGPAALAQASAAAGIPIVHVSTDYVFDGSKDGYYVEEDPVGPLGGSGAATRGGEGAGPPANPRHVVLRSASVVSAHGANFVKTMLRLGAERDTLRVVDDQRGCPTGAADIAATLLTIARRLIDDPQAPTGTYHFVNAGEASWCGFARAIFAESAKRGGRTPTVEAIATADYPTPARRPANSRLATAKLTRDYGIAPRAWQAMLAEIIAELTPAGEDGKRA